MTSKVCRADDSMRHKAIVNAARAYERCFATKRNAAREVFAARREGRDIALLKQHYRATVVSANSTWSLLKSQMEGLTYDQSLIVDGVLYTLLNDCRLVRTVLAEVKVLSQSKIRGCGVDC